ncbi:M28 family metallopeptidase [Kangiella sp. HZ709]|uniref:M28 family metallopeptidase n=1 Tax=Kangiella sp. HZ709 TaxID=2666328 RepID=UPI0012AFE1E6|nr:M20/M25/M40 family metallo-hydrolase [Kangiella sp. HZ709]MRX27676.1 M20/M25/M40 family metallo-hydrolase [Kangiella sp. HZ709]
MKYKSLNLILLSVFSLTACAQSKSVKPQELSTEDMMAYLVDDNKLGRETGSKPMIEIQQWLIEQYQAIGLKPLPNAKSFRQEFVAKTKKAELDAVNIIGAIDCNCDNDKYLIIGAHYDHVGINNKLKGDQIFNGADDDASGVVASLIIARELAKAPKLPFNIIIAAWDAEEKGLLGSKHFVDNPLVPLNKIESGFMFELVGSKSEPNNAWMTGFAYSSLYPEMKSQLKKQGWTLGEDPFAEQFLFMRSDNAPFAMMDMTKEKSNQVFMEGKKADITGIPMHAMSIWKGQPHYHQVGDDLSVIDFENLTNFSIAVANAIKSLPEDTKIEWLENPHFNFKRPQ